MNINGSPRCLVVWVAVSALAAATARWALDAIVLTGRFDQLVVGVAGGALAACAAWAWLVTTTVVVQALRGQVRPARGVPAWARRAVLAACGIAVLTTATAHASPHPSPHASEAGSAPSLDGLPFPDRALGPAHRADLDEPAMSVAGHRASYVVRPGESLWTIAEGRLSGGADAATVRASTAALYALNREAIGSDPDLVHPGLRLRLPDLSTAPTEETR